MFGCIHNSCFGLLNFFYYITCKITINYTFKLNNVQSLALFTVSKLLWLSEMPRLLVSSDLEYDSLTNVNKIVTIEGTIISVYRSHVYVCSFVVPGLCRERALKRTFNYLMQIPGSSIFLF